MAEPTPVTDRPHFYLAGLAQQGRYAHDFAKAGHIDEAIEHAEAIERLITAWRTAIGRPEPTDQAAVRAAALQEAADFVRGLLLTRTLVTTVSLEAELRRLADEQPTTPDTLPEWLYQRFAKYRTDAPAWSALTDDDQSYWAHEAAAVRRAVARGGFKRPAGPAAPAQQP